MAVRPHAARRLVLVVAAAEALTWVGLLTGMLFKYVVADDERGVQVFGPLHGAAFLAYLATILLVRRTLGWSRGVTCLALASSVPPLGSLVFEVWADRTGRLTPSPELPGPPDEPVPVAAEPANRLPATRTGSAEGP